MADNNPKQNANEKVLVASNAEMLELLAELIGEGKVVRLKVQGTSMMPFLRNGLDTVELSKPTDKDLTRGALVLFRYKDGFILHRIIKRKGNVLTIRGDNFYLTEKEVVTIDQVVGVVRKIVYSGGREQSLNSIWWKSLWRGWLCVKLVFWWPLIVISKLICFPLPEEKR